MINDIYCSSSSTASSSCFITESNQCNLGKSMLIVSSHHLPPPNDVYLFIIYSVPQSTIHKLYVCRRYQPTGFVTETRSIDVASRNIITPVHTVNKACSFAPYKASLHSICYKHSTSVMKKSVYAHIYLYMHICMYL